SFTAKGEHTRAHLVEHHTEREQIRACVEFLPLYLRRRHTGDRGRRPAGTRQMFCGLNSRRAQSSAVRLRSNLGQPEIENLRLASLRNEDVRWFHVTVNDPLRVCSIEGIGNLDGKIEH